MSSSAPGSELPYPLVIALVLINDIAQGLMALHEYHDHGINYYARVAQGIPAQVQAMAPQVPVGTNSI